MFVFVMSGMEHKPFGGGSIRITESEDRMWYEGSIPGLITIDGWSGYGLDEDWSVKIATSHFPLHALYPISFFRCVGGV